MKLAKNTLPKDHSFSDLSCFGPVAEKDGQFSGTKIADLGYFSDGEVDSNKRYFGCVCQSNLTKKWYAYFEHGRTSLNAVGYQFIECNSEQEAQLEYETQLHKKNDKRGEWRTVCGIQVLGSKKGKDCYLVRNLSSRDCLIPAARSIGNVKTVVSCSNSNFDSSALELLKDLNCLTSSYTKNSVVGGVIPSLDSIKEVRELLSNIKQSTKEKDRKELTNIIYSKIPKYKQLGVDVTIGLNNIQSWYDELDVFEQGSLSNNTGDEYYKNLPFNLKTLDGQEFRSIRDWFYSASRRMHSYIKDIKIYNIWKIEHRNKNNFEKKKKDIIGRPNKDPLHQPGELSKSGTYRLFHGTRSINVGGILREFLKLPSQLSGVHLSGKMFGGGVYHADDWGKAAGYTSSDSSYWSKGSGKVNGRKSFIFVNAVHLGQSYFPTSSVDCRRYVDGKNYHSVFADFTKCSLANNEFIVFDPDQVNFEYLFEVDII